MQRHRTTARGVLLSLLASGLAVVVTAASATGSSGRSGATKVPHLIFPLVATTHLWDNYGDPRGNGLHAGIDMENPWRAPVVAVEAGRVQHAESGLGGCMLYLYGRSGTTYMYIHLNNDLTSKNDNRGTCRKGVAFSVRNDARVTAGQQIGWNGDSGDAYGNPHLHFEVHPGGGRDVNPYQHLAQADLPLFAARVGSAFSLGLRGSLVAAGDAMIELEVDRVRHYPGGRWLDVEPRSVTLNLPSDATLPAGLSDVASGVRALVSPVPVVAHTARAKTTPAALLGAAASLSVKRVEPTR